MDSNEEKTISPYSEVEEEVQPNWPERHEELKKAALPLLEFLNKYYDPHCYAVVSEGRVMILAEDMATILPIRD